MGYDFGARTIAAAMLFRPVELSKEVLPADVEIVNRAAKYDLCGLDRVGDKRIVAHVSEEYHTLALLLT